MLLFLLLLFLLLLLWVTTQGINEHKGDLALLSPVAGQPQGLLAARRDHLAREVRPRVELARLGARLLVLLRCFERREEVEAGRADLVVLGGDVPVVDDHGEA